MKGIRQALRIRSLILITSLTCHFLMLIEKGSVLHRHQFPSSPPPYLRLHIIRAWDFFYHYTNYANERLLLTKNREILLGFWKPLSPLVPSCRDKASISPHPKIHYIPQEKKKNQNCRAAFSHMVGDPAAFWQDAVLRVYKAFHV